MKFFTHETKAPQVVIQGDYVAVPPSAAGQKWPVIGQLTRETGRPGMWLVEAEGGKHLLPAILLASHHLVQNLCDDNLEAITVRAGTTEVVTMTRTEVSAVIPEGLPIDEREAFADQLHLQAVIIKGEGRLDPSKHMSLLMGHVALDAWRRTNGEAA